jgi:hypothetical protein
MPKPTLTIGGIITAAEAREIAEMLAKERCPPIASEEGDDQTLDPPLDPEGAVSPDWYVEAIRSCGKSLSFIIGFHERDDSPRELMMDTGLDQWLRDREKRLAWRYYVPTHRDDDGNYVNGFVVIDGAGSPFGDDLRTSIVYLNANEEPFITIHSDVSSSDFIEEAKRLSAIADFYPPPLVIQG